MPIEGGVEWTTTTMATAAGSPPLFTVNDLVVLFGRLAEKYIVLDASAGMCCYSACSDCEYRLPDGGYCMADQSASRPKWIPVYHERSAGGGKQHTSKWSSTFFLFDNQTSITTIDFVARLLEMSYAPILGGPFVTASAAVSMTHNPTVRAAAKALYDELNAKKGRTSTSNSTIDGTSQQDRPLTRLRMSLRLREMAQGEEGLNWAQFASVIGAM